LVDELIDSSSEKRKERAARAHVYGRGRASEERFRVCKKIYDAAKALYPERLFLARESRSA